MKTAARTTVAALLAIVLVFAGVQALAAAPATVGFADANLESLVRDQLGKPVGDITDMDMQSLRFLTASGMSITDLTGLEYASNLVYLDVAGNRITALAPLSGLTSLKYLTMNSNQIADIGPLAGMVNLAFLDASQNQIADITPLARLGGLKWLYLGDNQVTDLAPLAGLSGLTNLNLGVNQIADVTSLSGLASLEELQLSSNRLTDITPLEDLSKLWLLDLIENYLDVTPGSAAMESADMLRAGGAVVCVDPQNALIQITSSAGANGSVSPGSVQAVTPGADVTFAIAAEPGFRIADVLVDDVSVGAVSSYTFSAVEAAHTISASFAKDAYIINASAGSNGAIDPAGAVSVDAGMDKTFNFTPAAGYRVATIAIDGGVATEATSASYTFTGVAENHAIAVTFVGTASVRGATIPDSAVVTSLSKPRISPSSRPVHGRRATVWAQLTPSAAAIPGTTKLRLYHWEAKTVRMKVDGGWKRVKVHYWRLRTTKTMKADADGRLSLAYKLPYSGRWKMIAEYSGASGYAPSTSPTRRITVR